MYGSVASVEQMSRRNNRCIFAESPIRESSTTKSKISIPASKISYAPRDIQHEHHPGWHQEIFEGLECWVMDNSHKAVDSGELGDDIEFEIDDGQSNNLKTDMSNYDFDETTVRKEATHDGMTTDEVNAWVNHRHHVRIAMIARGHVHE